MSSSDTPPVLDNQDIWRFDQVRARYRQYCERYGTEHSELDVQPYYLQRGWTAGILKILTERMKLGDLAAAHIGIEMMEEDRGLLYLDRVQGRIQRHVLCHWAGQIQCRAC